MRPIVFSLAGTSSVSVNSAIAVVNWSFTTSPGTGGGSNYILINQDPSNFFIVGGSSVSAAYQISGTYNGTVTRANDATNRLEITPNLADNVLAGAVISGTNVNAGGIGQSFIGVASLTGIDIGDAVTGSASIPANTTVTGFSVPNNVVYISNPLTANIAAGVSLTFAPSSTQTSQLVPLDLYISPQDVQWTSAGGTITATGFVGPMTNLVSAGAVTSPIINGAYSAINFVNSGAGPANVVVNQAGILT